MGVRAIQNTKKRVKMSKNVKRVITVVKESDHKGRFALNECLVKEGSISWTAYWSDETLKMEQLQDKLIAEGVLIQTLLRSFGRSSLTSLDGMQSFWP